MSTAADAEFDSQKTTLEQLVGELKGEVEGFEKQLQGASELSDLQQLDYQPLLDKMSKIETTVDEVPEDADVEDDEEDPR